MRSDAFESDTQLARGADLIVNNIALTLGIESLTLEEQLDSWPTARRAKVDIAIATNTLEERPGVAARWGDSVGR